MANVLVSATNMYLGLDFLPYIYGAIRLSCDENETLNKNLNWLPSLLHTTTEIDEVLDDYPEIHILALSCYEWNWLFQYDLARKVKQRYPNCTIIAGGPQPDWRDENYFEKYSFLDAIVKGECEGPVKELFLRLVEGHSHDDIPGVWTPRNFHTSAAKEIYKEPHLPEKSPYLEYEDDFKECIQRILGKAHPDIWVNWETARGCPYSCTFCDWGSATLSKIRTVPMDRLKAEAEWFGENKIDVVYISDANFGILPRDVEITDHLLDVKRRTGYPKTVFFNSPKNNPDRTLTILKKLNEAGMLNYCIQNNFQSTQSDVLQVMKRKNLAGEKQMDYVRNVRKSGFAMGAALIMGSPGESHEAFKASLYDVSEWGFHDELRIFNWALLPNAPAADRKHMDFHKMKVIERYTMRNLVNKDVARHPYFGKSVYLIEHSEMSKKDWVKNSWFGTLYLSTHSMALARYLAIYLRKTCGVSYEEIYTKIFNGFAHTFSDIHEELIEHFQNFIEDDDSIINMDFDEELGVFTDPEGWLFMMLADRKVEWFDFLKDFSHFQWGSSKNINDLSDVVCFNEALIIDPHYDPHIGREMELQNQWKDYFKEVELAELSDRSHFVPNKGDYVFKTNSRATGPYGAIPLDFRNGDDFDMNKYFYQVVGNKSSRHMRTFFNDYEISDSYSTNFREYIHENAEQVHH